MASLSASAGGAETRPPWASCRRRDLVVAAGAFALTLVIMHGHHRLGHGPGAWGIVLAALSSLPLAGRRGAPLTVFALTTMASALMFALGDVMGPPVGPTLALFYVAASERCRERPELTAAVVIVLGALHVGASATAQSGFPLTPLLAAAALWGGAWIVGDQARQRRLRRVEVGERAQRAKRETEHQRRLAAAEERTRIARDLHDSAAHAINVILVQAGGARLLQDRDPAAVESALTTIEEVARGTIDDIERLIRGLREDGSADANGDRVEPPIGLAAVDTLVALHRTAGLAVVIRERGTQRALSPGLDQAAYRILQESLTNAARHGAGSVDIDIAYTERRLELTISNPVATVKRDGFVGDGFTVAGHGIQGMRERANLLGGRFEATWEGGRFQVQAALPYAAEREPAR
ncbi:MAG: histidine kinase [Solirubrobacteraceae bacterium]